MLGGMGQLRDEEGSVSTNRKFTMRWRKTDTQLSHSNSILSERRGLNNVLWVQMGEGEKYQGRLHRGGDPEDGLWRKCRMSQGKCILDRENTLKKEVEPRNTQFVGLHVRMKWKTKLEGEKENVRVNHVSSPRIPAQGFKLFRPVGTLFWNSTFGKSPSAQGSPWSPRSSITQKKKNYQNLISTRVILSTQNVCCSSPETSNKQGMLTLLLSHFSRVQLCATP